MIHPTRPGNNNEAGTALLEEHSVSNEHVEASAYGITQRRPESCNQCLLSNDASN